MCVFKKKLKYLVTISIYIYIYIRKKATTKTKQIYLTHSSFLFLSNVLNNRNTKLDIY